MSRTEIPHRSASPLKRRASSMPTDENTDATDDVDMIPVPADTVQDLTENRDGSACVKEETLIKLEDEASQFDKAHVNGSLDLAQQTGALGQLDTAEQRLFGFATKVQEQQKLDQIEDKKPDVELDRIQKHEQDQGQEQEQELDQDQMPGLKQPEPSQADPVLAPASDFAIDNESTPVVEAVMDGEPPSVPIKLGLPALTENTSLNGSGRSSGRNSGRNSPSPLGAMTRGRKSDRVMGTTGLNNLGNTCYMNSALQCIRSVEELTKYFVAEEHKKELNRDNPLGHNGNVALAYGNLLRAIYKSPPPQAYAPRPFKETIGRYAPSFSGYGQQDSQEFLGFLLDGLQEDLNRVAKKPYIEKPDSTDDMINNPDALREMAAKVWDITKKRDDSVIADLFTGMYKSTLVCPDCSKVSITFEPFNNLTLPLPMQNIWQWRIKYFPLNDVPVEIDIEVDRHANFKTVKEFISARVGVPSDRLLGAEDFKNKFFKIYEDDGIASDEITSTDVPIFYELEAAPTNLLLKTKKKYVYKSLLDNDGDNEEEADYNDAMAERMVLPVVHRFRPREKPRGYRTPDCVAPPHFIMLNPREARDEDAIRRKILEKVATLTTWSHFHSSEDSDTADNTDQELSLATTSDGSSSGDSRIVAKSVEGEDDIVDVTMKDARECRKTAEPEVSQESANILKKFNKQRPKWLNPTAHLDGALQNLFEIGYFTEGGKGIPSGWSVFNNATDRPMPSIESRKPRLPTPSDHDMASPGAYLSATPSDESSTEDVSSAPTFMGVADDTAFTRMNTESSEDDKESLPDLDSLSRLQPPQAFNNKFGSRGGRKKMKGKKTYSRKGNKRFNKQQQAAARHSLVQQRPYEDNTNEDEVAYDGGPLIRIGEGIVVEWDPDAWELVFGNDDISHGRPTFIDLETLKDPEMEEKRRAREYRRKNGISLYDCLSLFEKDEILSEQDMWYCPRCKLHRRAAKKFDLWKTPDILVVHLKRFSSSASRRDKIDIKVDFPIEGLDLTSRVVEKEDGKQEVYDLIAIDDHLGGLGGGHYTAYAKNFVDQQWYKFDDTYASKQTGDLSRMVTGHAYLLFYRRRSEGFLGGPKLREIMEQFAEQDSEDAASSPASDTR